MTRKTPAIAAVLLLGGLGLGYVVSSTHGLRADEGGKQTANVNLTREAALAAA